MTFSIIIPVYNVENYIRECLNSVLKQTYPSWELILVDDGSTDASSAICDEYLKIDERIRVIHKSNNGSSSARNIGIIQSKGDYIIFLDSDDFWNKNCALSEIAKKLKDNYELICFGYKKYDDVRGYTGKGIDFGSFHCTSKDKNILLKEMMINGIYVSSAWCKVVKRNVIIENNLFFKLGVTSEDIDWSARLLKCVTSIGVYPESFYTYRQRTSSIAHCIKYENLEMLCNNIIECIHMGDELAYGDFRCLFLNYVAYQYITFFVISLRCENSDRKTKLIKKMHKYDWLLKYNLNKKVKMVYLANKIFGYNMIFRLLKIYS